MRFTKTIQSSQVIHSVINQVKVDKSLNYSVNTVLLTGCGKKIKIVRYFGGKLCGEKH